jgi:adenylate cyclase
MEPAEQPVPRPAREAAVMFAELIGAAELQARAGDAAQATIAACIDQIQATVSARTRVVKRLRARLMLLADSADTAARAATAMQMALQDFPAAGTNKLGLGVGFHYGPVIQDNADVFGDTVNLAARLVEQAAQGQIVLESATAKRIAPPFDRFVRRLYPVRLKGFEEAVDLCEVVWRVDEAATVPPFEAVPRATRATLQLTYRGHTLTLRRAVEEITVGRDAGCQVVVDGEHASRHHCTIERRNDHFVVTDRSSNGTFVTIDGEEEVRLRRDDMVLRRRGWISFGRSRSAGDDALEFFCD